MTLSARLAEERRARLAAERTLELKQAELFDANRKLGLHARALSDRIEETEAEVATVRVENEKVKSDLNVAHHKIEVAERRLWHAIEAFQDGFAFFDSDSHLIAANQAYLQVFDGLDEVAPGITYARILQILTDEGVVDIEGMDPAEWRARMTRRWQAPVLEPVTLRLWNNSYVKILDQRNAAGDVVSLALDITDTVRYEKRLRAAQRRAEAANRAKSAFLANMSHEIRTPMNGVVGMADLLGGTEMSDEQRLYVDTIRNSGEALLEIINDVLDYSKIEADKLVLHPEPFDLERIIHEVVLLLQPTAQAKGIDLLVDYDLFTPTGFVGDGGRLRQVLTNLVGNAVKFTPQGHVLVRVVGLPEDNGATALHITVEDTGIGIPRAKLGHVFGQFNQVEDDRNRSFGGTGLGLAISKQLISLMHGDIWVDSDEGAGACFGLRVTLPVAGASGVGESVPDLPLERVLVVDPKTASRKILCTQLEALNLSVDSCETGAQALDQFDNHDIVLADQDLGDTSAIKLAAELADRGHGGIVVAFCENPGALNDAENTLKGLLPKPATRKALLAQLDSLDRPDPDQPEPLADGPQPAPDRPLRVLVAEDNRTNQLVFRKMVEALSFDLTFANNGLEAVKAFETDTFDLIFMDISMPKMDGREATARIRTLPGGPKVPIVAVTAHAMAGDRESLLEAGLDDYLTKPLRREALVDMIEKHLPAHSRATDAA